MIFKNSATEKHYVLLKNDRYREAEYMYDINFIVCAEVDDLSKEASFPLACIGLNDFTYEEREQTKAELIKLGYMEAPQRFRSQFCDDHFN